MFSINCNCLFFVVTCVVSFLSSNYDDRYIVKPHRMIDRGSSIQHLHSQLISECIVIIYYYNNNLVMSLKAAARVFPAGLALTPRDTIEVLRYRSSL